MKKILLIITFSICLVLVYKLLFGGPRICQSDAECSGGQQCFECHDGRVTQQAVKHCLSLPEIRAMQAKCAAM